MFIILLCKLLVPEKRENRQQKYANYPLRKLTTDDGVRECVFVCV